MNIIQLQKALVATHVEALTNDYRANCLLMRGGPGIGKSQGIMQSVEMLARIVDEPCGLVICMLANYSSVDLMGFMLPHYDTNTKELQTIFSTPMWYPTNKNTMVYDPHAEDTLTGEPTGRWFTPRQWEAGCLAASSSDEAHDGRPPRYGVVFVDEWSQTDEDVQKPTAELILNARVGDRELEPGWRVLTAGNRLSDRAGAVRELSHIINRRCLINVDGEMDSWVKWAERQSGRLRPHYMTINFVRSHADAVFQPSVPDGNKEYCTARSLCKMDMDLRALRTGEEKQRDVMPTSDMAREFCTGWIGEGATSQYFTHLKYYERIPEIEDIVKDPSSAKLPPEKDAQMVTAYKLAHHVTTETCEPIFHYMKRLHKEMQIATVTATLGDRVKALALRNSKNWGPWIIENGELLMAAKA